MYNVRSFARININILVYCIIYINNILIYYITIRYVYLIFVLFCDIYNKKKKIDDITYTFFENLCLPKKPIFI